MKTKTNPLDSDRPSHGRRLHSLAGVESDRPDEPFLFFQHRPRVHTWTIVQSRRELKNSVERLNGSSKRSDATAITGAIHQQRMQSMRSGSFESLRSVKNLERLSKKQKNNQATDQSGTVDFFFAAPS